MKLLAIDPGTNTTGIALFNSCSLLIKTVSIRTKIKDRYDRTQNICSQLMISMEDIGFDWNSSDHTVVCEEPMMQGKANTSMQRLLGSFEFLFAPKLNYIHPMTVKAKMGSGSLDKLEVALAAGRLVSTEEERELVADAVVREAFDETDAVAIGLSFINREKANETIN